MSTGESTKKIRLELLDGTVEATGTEEFLRRAQALFVRLAGPVDDVSFGITEPQFEQSVGTPMQAAPAVTDIRTLREQKQPRNQVEMAALVAYYVTELAPTADRKETINAEDIKRYFGQASYQTNSPPRMVLSNAKTGGYLDSPSSGEYKLNPVGYNLVTAGLPADGGKRRRSPRRRKRAPAKSTRKKS